MSDTHETRRIVEAVYRAAAVGDLDTLRGHLHEQVVVHEPPALPYGGSYQGWDQFVACFSQVMGVIDLTSLTVHSLTVEGSNAFAIVTVPLTTGNDAARIVEQWVLDDGKVSEIWVSWFDTTIVPDTTSLPTG